MPDEFMSELKDEFAVLKSSVLQHCDTRIDEQNRKLRELLERSSRPDFRLGPSPPGESLGAQVARSQEVKSFLSGSIRGSAKTVITGRLVPPLTTKAMIASDTGTLTPPSDHFLAPLPAVALGVADLIPQRTSTAGSVTVVRQTAPFPGAGIQVAQGDQKAETTLTFATVELPFVTIANWCAISKQAAQDVPALRQTIDFQLIWAIRTLEEYEILRGDGTAGHLSGILPVATAVTADAADTPIDFVARLIGTLAASGISATGVVLHPSDLLAMSLSKTTNEEYLLGSPTQAPAGTLWSVPLALSSQLPVGTALVGDFQRGANLIFREQPTVEISSEHADFFIKNLLAIRGEERVQLIINQSSYFVKGTIPEPAALTTRGSTLPAGSSAGTPAPAKEKESRK